MSKQKLTNEELLQKLDLDNSEVFIPPFLNKKEFILEKKSKSKFENRYKYFLYTVISTNLVLDQGKKYKLVRLIELLFDPRIIERIKT